jgi:hypothetical protein
MTTRYSKFNSNSNSIDLGYEGISPKDYIIPSCNLEDVDRAVYDFFDKQAIFQYTHQGASKKVPVIFATGERFAILRRKKPLRDKHGALILPLISLMRTDVNMTNTMGIGYSELLPLKVKVRVAKQNENYQRVNNFNELENARNAQVFNRQSGGLGGLFYNQKPPEQKIVYETITIPPVKFFTATYDITFWCQYTQQMTEMMATLMASFQNNYQRTVRLETTKGYWFVGYFGEQFNSDNNFDSMNEEERLIKHNFQVTVPAYLVAPDQNGIGKSARSFVNSPYIELEYDL